MNDVFIILPDVVNTKYLIYKNNVPLAQFKNSNYLNPCDCIIFAYYEFFSKNVTDPSYCGYPCMNTEQKLLYLTMAE